MPPMSTAAVPIFYLYGEPHRSAAAGFVHAEPIDDRSRPSDWTIRPHAHTELVQVFVVLDGGGAMLVEDRRVAFEAPCLLLLPAGVVHGFDWLRESSGHVVTVVAGFAAELARADPALPALFRAAIAAPINATDAGHADRIVRDLSRELGWAAPGHRAAVSTALLSLMVLLLRSAAPRGAEAVGREATVVARLRERIEDRFRRREAVETYAAALGVSLTALRTACARMGAPSPAAMLDARALLEAKRQLVYTRAGVSEIAWSLGFADAAYFSRFFRRHVGVNPRAYRMEPGIAGQDVS